MNTRQRAGVGLGVSGIIALALGIIVGTTGVTPAWVDPVLRVLGVAFPLVGIAVNFPSDTNPK
jgi:hypothetical protein